MAVKYKLVTLKDPVTGDYLIPRAMGGLSYEVTDGGEIVPPFDPQLDADTLEGKKASEFALATHNHDTTYAAKSHNHAAANITAGTLGGKVQGNAAAMANLGEAQIRDIYAGTSDIGVGASLPTGTIYLVYE